ncbi:hypothetical protein Acr_26g0000110 [Actinidia rufa]|uniref:Uncharacterized protein n=1 Tax=Actinidia rufa TaxID=165716 RepID=A0A7J0H199_9ERIC|nr:hypothetical protein Acr_26g0000110 [Actinidia rufa]
MGSQGHLIFRVEGEVNGEVSLRWSEMNHFGEVHHETRDDSVGTEMHQAQQFAKELEGQVAEIGAREQQAVEELKKMKEDMDGTMARLEVEVTELKKKEALAKKTTIDEYKSSIGQLLGGY